MTKVFVISLFCVMLSVIIHPTQSRKLRDDLAGSNSDSVSTQTHKHEEIFLPLNVEPDGTVDGLLIEDNEAERGPLLIEEVVNESGEVTEVIIERVSDLTPDKLPRRQATNRKLGDLTSTHSKTSTQSESTNKTSSSGDVEGRRKKKKNPLALVLVLIASAFVLGFFLSAFFWRGSSLDRFMLDRKSRLALNKKLSINPQPWRAEKELYSPTRSSVRSPKHRFSKRQESPRSPDHEHNHI